MSNKVRRPSKRGKPSTRLWLAACLLTILLAACGLAYAQATRDQPLPRVRGAVLMYTSDDSDENFPAALTIRILNEYSNNPTVELIPSFDLPRGARARYALLLRGDATLDPGTVQTEHSDGLTIANRRVNGRPRLRSVEAHSDSEGSESKAAVQVITGTVYGPSKIPKADLRSSTVGLTPSTSPIIRGRTNVRYGSRSNGAIAINLPFYGRAPSGQPDDLLAVPGVSGTWSVPSRFNIGVRFGEFLSPETRQSLSEVRIPGHRLVVQWPSEPSFPDASRFRVDIAVPSISDFSRLAWVDHDYINARVLATEIGANTRVQRFVLLIGLLAGTALSLLAELVMSLVRARA
jgi:hypothetical protein